jgi:quinolinate synthase
MMLWQPPLPSRYLEMTDDELARAITARRKQLGSDLLILGHHYQQDSVIQHADLTGDSLKLSQMAAEESVRRGVKWIVFCGVHFMAETADILAPDDVAVILPDLSAGCSMADMAEYDDVVEAWEILSEVNAESDEATERRSDDLDDSPCVPGRSTHPRALSLRGRGNGDSVRIIPITYVNSTAAIKAFVGEHGGACCTSTNATEVFKWALSGGTQPRADDEVIKVIFLPDQHLGRNTASKLGFVTEIDVARDAARGTAQTHLWNPRKDRGGLTDDQIRSADVYLWAGHCSVHKLFRPEHVDQAREAFNDAGGVTVLVHPECVKEVVDKADLDGSTEYIIRTIRNAPAGSNWAVGTEHHLVQRLAREAAKRGVNVRILSDCQCLCTTMFRIDPQHLLWTLDNLAEGKVVNQVKVNEKAAELARLALDRMLAHVGVTPSLPAHVD